MEKIWSANEKLGENHCKIIGTAHCAGGAAHTVSVVHWASTLSSFLQGCISLVGRDAYNQEARKLPNLLQNRPKHIDTSRLNFIHGFSFKINCC